MCTAKVYYTHTSTCAYLPSKALARIFFNLVAAALLAAALLYDSEPTSVYRFGSTQLQVDGLSTLNSPTHHVMAQHSLGAELQLLRGHVAVTVACVPAKIPSPQHPQYPGPAQLV